MLSSTWARSSRISLPRRACFRSGAISHSGTSTNRRRVQLRVRNGQLGSFQNHITEKEDVQINDPVGPAEWAGPASHLPFEGLTVLQESLPVPDPYRRPPLR